MSNRTAPSSFDALARGYDFLDSTFNNNDFFLSHMPQRRVRALDVGCGTGIVAQALAPHFGHVRGIDISEGMLHVARTQRGAPNISYENADATTLDPGCEQYDYIVSRTTLHHIADKPALLGSLAQMCAPGGRVVILDCVCETRTVPRWKSMLTPFLCLPGDLATIGPRAAARIFTFRISKPWLDHLAADVYLTYAEAESLFSSALPGCSISRVSVFLGAVWENSADNS